MPRVSIGRCVCRSRDHLSHGESVYCRAVAARLQTEIPHIKQKEVKHLHSFIWSVSPERQSSKRAREREKEKVC